ncbi:hypothetical protein V8P95_15130 [Acinetobacter baumannii]
MTKFIKQFSKKLQEFSKHHLLIFAFGMLGLLILAGTIIINIFWGGSPCLQLATNATDNKDYMTLYLAMLSVLATLFGSFVVIYAYGAWKEQHNKVIHSERTMELINHLKSFNLVLTQAYIPIGQVIKFSKKDINLYPDKNLLVKEQLDKFVVALNLIIDNSAICYWECSYYVGYARSEISKETFIRIKNIRDIIQTHKEIFLSLNLAFNYEDSKSEYEQFQLLDIYFHQIAAEITMEILPDLYNSLNAIHD